MSSTDLGIVINNLKVILTQLNALLLRYVVAIKPVVSSFPQASELNCKQAVGF